MNDGGETERAGRLRRVAGELGSLLTLEEAHQLDAFCVLFGTWNRKINLGGAQSFEDLVDEHLVDAFAARRLLVPGDFVIDVGSGGGLPAIPLSCLVPKASFELWEPRAKRAAFLRTAVRELGLRERVEVVCRRVELPAFQPSGHSHPLRPRAYTLAMSRATWAPVEWLELARKIAPGARVVAFTTATGVLTLSPPDEVVAYGLRRLAVFLPSS